MAEGKGFGARRQIQVVTLHGSTKADFDRCMAVYKQQGLSYKDALYMVAVSNLYAQAVEQGLAPGVDVRYDSTANDGEGVLYLSPDMRDHIKAHVPRQLWNYLEAEEVITEGYPPELMEIDGEMAVDEKGFAQLLLNAIRHPEETNDGGIQARQVYHHVLQYSPMSDLEAQAKLHDWLSGNEDLHAELVYAIARSLNKAAREQMSDNANG